VDNAEFAKRLASSLAHKRGIVIFVHGFNNSFADAVTRALASAACMAPSDVGVVAADLNSKAAFVPVVFSWPSRESVSHYFSDESVVDISTALFEDFLCLVTQVAELVGKPVNVLAHSMGSRIVLEGVYQVVVKGLPAPKSVVFAAPDVDRATFEFKTKKMCAASSSPPLLLLLASGRDVALNLSGFRLRDACRAGFVDETFGCAAGLTLAYA